MAKYNFYLCYSHKDTDLVQEVYDRLTEKGYTCAYNIDPGVGTDWVDQIVDTISNSDCFIPVITDNFLSSTITYQELHFALRKSAERAQDIFPLLYTDHPLPSALEFQMSAFPIYYIETTEHLTKAVGHIDRLMGYQLKSAELYEKLAQYRELKHHPKVAETICQILDLIITSWPAMVKSKQRLLCPEICSLMEQLALCPCPYGKEAKAIGDRILETVGSTGALLESDANQYANDLFFSAFAVRLLYWKWEAKVWGFDLHYGGDVYQGIIDPWPIAKGIEYQKPYLDVFQSAFDQVKDTLDNTDLYTPQEAEFIRQTTNYVLSDEKNGITPFGSYAPPAEPKSKDEDILVSVAKFMQEGNKLFDVLQKQGIAGDFLKCLLTSYDRLKNYCQIVGANDVAAECVDRIVEIRSQLEKQTDAPTINNKAETGIKSLLGLTLPGSGSYDVFISFKNEDSDLAEKVYHLCQKHMKVPFWSKRTLPELSASEYENAIYDALKKSKHFVIVLSKLEYLEANWIKEEMSVFNRAIKEGRKPNGNFVFVVTDDLYKEIIACNKTCLDERYCGYQILKMSEYESTLMSYIR